MPAPAHKPTEESRTTVRALATYGIPREEIAHYIGVTEKTLKKYYDEEVLSGRSKTNAAVGQFLARMATGQAMKDKDQPASRKECLTAAIFWAKTRMGFQEQSRPKSPLAGILSDYG